MKITLNLLTGTTAEKAYEPVEVSKLEFIKYYLKVNNLVTPLLTDREIDFLAAFCIDKDPKFIQKESHLSATNYYGMFKRLVEKGFIVDGEPHRNLAKIVTYMDKLSSPHFDIVFPFKIS